MNAVIERFMALQKYLWMLKTHHTHDCAIYGEESAEYSEININSNCQVTNGHNTRRNTEVCTGVLPRNFSGFLIIVDGCVVSVCKRQTKHRTWKCRRSDRRRGGERRTPVNRSVRRPAPRAPAGSRRWSPPRSRAPGCGWRPARRPGTAGPPPAETRR